ncbi:MAG: NAD(P)H-dependent oxidoreductase [Ramlibacter sp.]|nr:NAD(P)H-dependent oxidoreductase [Ramlibacter sp.]
MEPERKPLILGIGGAARTNSSSEKALRISLEAAEACGVDVAMVTGASLDLPMYAPHLAVKCEAQAQHLVDLFRRCDGVIISSPSYHGSVSGLIKNALDYTEELAKDARVYLDGCPVGVIGCCAGWQGANQVVSALRGIAHALRGWPTPMAAALNTSQPVFDEHGLCIDRAALFQLQMVGRQVAEFALMKARACEPCGA